MKLFKEYQGLRKEIYVLFASKIVSSVGSMIWMMMTLLLTQKLELSVSEAATWMLIYSIAGIPLQYLGGFLADHFSKKNIIIITDIFESIIYFYCFIVPFTKVSMIICLIGCALENLSGPAYDSLLSDLSSAKDRERANSLLYLGCNIGVVIAPTISGFIINYNVNIIFLVNAVCTFVVLTVEFFLLKDTSVEKNDNVYEVPCDNEGLISVLWRNKLVLLFIIVLALECATYSQYNVIIPLDLVREFEEKGTIIFGTISGLNAFVVLTFTSLITRFCSKISEIGKYFYGLILMGLGYIIFVLWTSVLPCSYIAIIVFTFGEILMSITSNAILTKRTPSSHRGRISSFCGILSNVIVAIFQKYVSNVYEFKGSLNAWIIILVVIGLIIIMMYFICVNDKKCYPELYVEKK